MLKKTSEGSKAFEKTLNNPLLKRHREKNCVLLSLFLFYLFIFFWIQCFDAFFHRAPFLVGNWLKKRLFCFD